MSPVLYQTRKEWLCTTITPSQPAICYSSQHDIISTFWEPKFALTLPLSGVLKLTDVNEDKNCFRPFVSTPSEHPLSASLRSRRATSLHGTTREYQGMLLGLLTGYAHATHPSNTKHPRPPKSLKSCDLEAHNTNSPPPPPPPKFNSKPDIPMPLGP